jgi:hypothetical protein
MRRSPIPFALPALAGLIAAAALPGLTAAASPSPEPPHDPNTEVWQDQALPPDVPEGRTVDVGFTIWDIARQNLSQVNSAMVRAHPKTGKAKATEATTHSDWAGHVIAPITIPKGGLGRIELGFPATECHDDGTCVELFIPFTWGGVGPPPDAPRSLLVNATIAPPSGPVVVGQPFDVAVDIEPRADWDPNALALPTTVVLIGSQLRGGTSTQTDMRQVDDRHYEASITVNVPGDTVLTVGLEPKPGELQIIDRAALRLQVEGGDAAATPAASRVSGSAAAPLPATDEGPPLVPLALGAVALVAGALVLRRVLADL